MKKLGENKSGVSAIVATVFLVLITITAVSIIWGAVIPFIKGNLNYDQRHVDLRIVTENGYTVYDKDQGIAYIAVSRGNDNETIAGMQILIDFDGTTYSVTEKAPVPGAQKSYFFVMTDMKANGHLPRTVSVAPVFVLDARQVLGEITSTVAMPILTIVKSYTDIVLDMTPEQKSEVANITEENKTVDLVTYCPGSRIGRDPWGGCPIATGESSSVKNDYGDVSFDFSSAIDSGLTNKGIKFKGDNCVVKNDTCTSFEAISTNPFWNNNPTHKFIQIADGSVLNRTSFLNGLNCVGHNWFYVYDSIDCK